MEKSLLLWFLKERHCNEYYRLALKDEVLKTHDIEKGENTILFTFSSETVKNAVKDTLLNNIRRCKLKKDTYSKEEYIKVMGI